MTDVFDRAQELEQRQREAALANFAACHPDSQRASISHCKDCGEPIPDARQRAVKGCTRCIDCQEDHEREQAR